MASPAAMRRQSGAALIVAIIFLLLLATLAMTGLRASTTNVTIIGNMQARQEVISTAQMLIEQTVSSDEFARNPQGVFAAASVSSDFNGDGTTDANATLAVAPVCLRARVVNVIDLDPDNPIDAGCFASAALSNPGFVPAGGGPVGSLCADTEWHLSARATDARTGAAVTINQGVTLRTAVVGLNTVCQ
jgi:hypothetical protein